MARILLFVFSITLVCSPAHEAGAQEPARVPRLAVGVGGGTPWGEGGPAALLSIQVPIARYLVVEGEATRRSYKFGDEITTLGGNLLFTAQSGRASMFAGGGLGVHRTTAEPVSVPLACVPPGAHGCRLLVEGRDSGVVGQAGGGVEIGVTPRLGTFAAVRVGTAPEDGIRMFAGMRAALLMRDARPLEAEPPPRSSLAGKEIRVLLADGTKQKGRLVTLSDTEVSFVAPRQQAQATIPLARVLKVETVSHHARTGAIIGAAAGGVLLAIGYSGDCADCEDRRIGFLFPPAFAGVGAAVGGMINLATANRRVLHVGLPAPGTVGIAPIVSPRHQGVALIQRW